MFQKDATGTALLWRSQGYNYRLQPWGRDGLRLRATPNPTAPPETLSALLPDPISENPEIRIGEEGNVGSLRHGNTLITVTGDGFTLRDVRRDETLLSTRKIEFVPREGRLFTLNCDFDAYEDERLYGLGQHQNGFLNQKGCVVALLPENREVPIPLLVSSRGYGLLWNNPAIGQVELARNRTRWRAESTEGLDLWLTVGDYGTVLERYTDVTGHAPPLPEWASGFWQSKLRYQTQDELLFVAREYKRRGLPLSVIVLDTLHWTAMGEWKFHPDEWPDPQAMVNELREMGVELMVSIWPTVTPYSETFSEMQARGYLVLARQGLPILNEGYDRKPTDGQKAAFYNYDSTHPDARRFVYDRVRDGYRKYGIRLFWLDAAEPETQKNPHTNLRFHAGDGLTVGCLPPHGHNQGFYEGLSEDGESDFVLLTRSGWAGSQRFGTVFWSGDVASDWKVLQAQVRAGLNMGLSGIPWWTTDIGGFKGYAADDPEFQELLIRWFQFGTFCPIFRLHGFREPSHPLHGGPNEVWSFSERTYHILRDYLFRREQLRPYIHTQMDVAHRTGTPVMRPLFFDYPNDPQAQTIEDAYLFGPDFLVAPVLEKGVTERSVYLPSGFLWQDAWTGETYDGGQTITVAAPLERLPHFLRC